MLLTRPRNQHQTKRATGPSPPRSPVFIAPTSTDSNGNPVNPDTSAPVLRVSPGETSGALLIETTDDQLTRTSFITTTGGGVFRSEWLAGCRAVPGRGRHQACASVRAACRLVSPLPLRCDLALPSACHPISSQRLCQSMESSMVRSSARCLHACLALMRRQCQALSCLVIALPRVP